MSELLPIMWRNFIASLIFFIVLVVNTLGVVSGPVLGIVNMVLLVGFFLVLPLAKSFRYIWRRLNPPFRRR